MPPGTVSYDLPGVGVDLDPEGWESGFKNTCEAAGHDEKCLRMDVVVSERQPDGSLKDIKTPGPDYGAVYSACLVTSISPEPGTEVPVPTTVIIKVVCTLPDAAGS